jgi:hypothetical protein
MDRPFCLGIVTSARGLPKVGVWGGGGGGGGGATPTPPHPHPRNLFFPALGGGRGSRPQLSMGVGQAQSRDFGRAPDIRLPDLTSQNICANI